MALKLNSTREAYREFYGKNVEQMPALIADGRVPISAAQLMQKRLNVRNAEAESKSAWMDNYFDTGDAIAYHPDGRVKVVLDSQTLREMTPESKRNGGALVLGEDVYKALQGIEFKKGKLGNTGNWMSKADVKAHPVWKALARDQALLNDYADYIFGEYQARFAKDTPINDVTAMGVFPSSCQSESPEMRAWLVNGLEARSFVVDRGNLDYNLGRFVGIAPEAQVAKNLGSAIVVPSRKVLSVEQVLAETAQTSAYAPDQIKKLQNILDQQGYTIVQRILSS